MSSPFGVSKVIVFADGPLISRTALFAIWNDAGAVVDVSVMFCVKGNSFKPPKSGGLLEPIGWCGGLSDGELFVPSEPVVSVSSDEFNQPGADAGPNPWFRAG